MKTERKIKSKNLITAFRELGDAFAAISLGMSEKQYREYKRRNKLKKIVRWIVRMLMATVFTQIVAAFLFWEFPVDLAAHSPPFRFWYFMALFGTTWFSDELLDLWGWGG